MSDWDQSGRLLFRGGRSLLGKQLSVQDLLLGTFCLWEGCSQALVRPVAARVLLCKQVQTFQTGLGLQAFAGIATSCY